jgi:hypothetical protein
MSDAAGKTGEAKRKRGGPLRRVLRIAFRLAATGLALLLLLLLLLPWITNTGAVRGLVARTIAGKLRSADVSIAGLRVAPLREEVFALEGLRMAPAGRPAEPVVTLGRFAVRWKPLELLHRRVHLTSVSIESLQCDLRQEPDGWNVLNLLPKVRKPLTLAILHLPVAVQVDALQARGIGLTVSARPGLSAAVEDVSGDAAVQLSGFIQGTANARLQTGRISVETPQGAVRLDKGLAANASYENATGRPRLAGTLTVPQMVAEVAGLGATQPLPVGASFDAEADLATLELPRADLAWHVPGLISDELTLSLRGGPDYVLSARSRAAADAGALLHALPSLARGPLESLDAGGRVLDLTDLDASLALKPHLHAYALLRNTACASGMYLSAAVRPAAVKADLKDLRASFRQEVAVAYDGALGGLSVTDLSGGLGSARVAAGPDAAGELDDLEFGLTAGVALPAAARVELAARVRGAATVEHPLVGKLSLPLAGAVRVSGTDLAGPHEAAAAAVDLSGSAGGLSPGVWLALRAPALWTQPLTLRAGGALDVGRAIALVGALPAAARGPVESLTGAGAAGADLQADVRPGSGVAVTCVGAADLSALGAGVRGMAGGVGRLEPTFALELATDGRFLPRNVRAAGAVHAEKITAPLGVTLGAADKNVRLDWRMSAPSALHAVVSASLSDLAAHPALPPLSMKMAGEVTLDAVAGGVTTANCEFLLPGLLSVSSPEFKLTGFGGGALAGSAHAELPDLGKLVALAAGALPPALRARLPAVSGRAAGDVELGGRLPLAETMLASLLHGARPALPKLLPIAAFLRGSAPVSAKAHLTAEDVTVIQTLSEKLQAGVRGLRTEATLDLAAGGDLKATLTAQLPEAVFTPSPLPLKDFRVQAEAGLRGFDALDLKGTFSGLGGVVKSSASLSVEGLSRLPLPPTPADALRTLALSAHAEGTLEPGALKLVEGLESSGGLALGLDATLEPGRSLKVAFAPAMHNFSASFRDLFALRGLDGGFTYARQWQIAEAGAGSGAEGLSQGLIRRPPVSAPPGIEQAFPEFATAVDELVDHAAGVSMASLSVLGAQVVEGLNVRLLANGSTLLVPRFAMRLLGGLTVGTAAFAPADGGRELRAQGEFTQVDFRWLLPAELRDFSGDSRISGSFSFSTLLGSATGGSPLKDISAGLDLSHIGPVALDRLLLALDPRSANPALVRLRGALSLAGPSSAHARLQRGFLSGSVELQGAAGSLVSEYAIPPFNLSGLFGMKMVDDALRKLAPAMQALDLLDATRIELTPEGGVRLR